MNESPSFNRDLSSRVSGAAGVLPDNFFRGIRELARTRKMDEESWQLSWYHAAGITQLVSRSW